MRGSEGPSAALGSWSGAASIPIGPSSGAAAAGLQPGFCLGSAASSGFSAAAETWIFNSSQPERDEIQIHACVCPPSMQDVDPRMTL